MGIENNLKRIADALESLVAQRAPVAAVAAMPPAAVPPVPPVAAMPPAAVPPVAAVAAVAAVPPVAAVAAVPPVATVAAVPPVAGLKTAEEMNTMLVAEFKRIGDRVPIDQAMAVIGVTSVTDLSAEKQAQLIASVAAIPSKS